MASEPEQANSRCQWKTGKRWMICLAWPMRSCWRLASSVRRGDPSATLSPTALVNEAWLKLADSPNVACCSRLHFKRIAARAMRQLLIEAARRRNSLKRGNEFAVVTFDESLQPAATCARDLLALDAALDELARIEPRQAMMIESRFFGGFDVRETKAG